MIDYIEWLLEQQELGNIKNLKWTFEPPKHGEVEGHVTITFDPAKPAEAVTFNFVAQKTQIQYDEIA